MLRAEFGDPDTRARDEGMERTVIHTDPRIILAIDAAIQRANASGEAWSCNDIRDQFPVSSQGLVGARVRSAAMRGQMVHTGRYVKSTLPGTHRAEIKVWVGKP